MASKLIKRILYLLIGLAIFLVLVSNFKLWDTPVISSYGKPAVQNETVGLETVLQHLELGTKVPIDVVVIFTKVKNNYVLQYNLKRAIGSLLKRATVPVRLHLISDTDGYVIAQKILGQVQRNNELDTRHLKLVFVSAEHLAANVRPTVQILQKYFTRRENLYYRDFLFFFSLFLAKLLPGLENVVMLDIDILVKGDIAELYSHFNKFSDTQIIGMGPELSPVYRHLLERYRKENPHTSLGSPHIDGGFSGFNSGVMLIKIPRLKNSLIIDSYLNHGKLEQKTEEFSYRGDLGDQDLYTLMYFDHPQLFYVLPCEWNRQRCEWWRTRGYAHVFDRYFECVPQAKIIHGNCKSEIPSDDQS